MPCVQPTQHSAAGGPAAGGVQPALNTHPGRAWPAAAGWTQAACPTGGAAGPAGGQQPRGLACSTALQLATHMPERRPSGTSPGAGMGAFQNCIAASQGPHPPPHLYSQGGVPQLHLPSHSRASQGHHAPLPVCGAAAGAAAGQKRGRLLHVPAQRVQVSRTHAQPQQATSPATDKLVACTLMWLQGARACSAHYTVQLRSGRVATHQVAKSGEPATKRRSTSAVQ